MTDAGVTAVNHGERGFDLAMLRQAAQHLGAKSLKDGSWFKKLVAEHAKKHGTMVTAATWERVYPGLDADQRAQKHIDRVALKASAAGALASIGASTGELLSLLTEGLAAPIGLPAAAMSMGLEAAYTALLQVDLACDLASIYGVPFDPEDTGELATLFAVALEVDLKPKKHGGGGNESEGAPGGLTERLIDLEEGEVATRIGRKLLEEAVMRNVIPFVGVAISARWNYVATRVLGKKASRYFRYRHALEAAFSKLDLKAITEPLLLVEGAWLLSNADGEASHEELMGIAALVDVLSPDKKLDVGSARLDDDDAWFERLAKSPREWHGAMLDALYLVAGADRELQVPERRVLRQIGKALGRDVDFERIEQICRHLADGDDLPADFASHAPAAAG